ANAVKRFQSVNGLTADGIYGPKTRAKLEDLLK
ncbi:peptidoglycan-binding domain-containing protein, partial [Bacillus vallismortis]